MNLIKTLAFAYLCAQFPAPAAEWHGFATRIIELPSTGSATLVIPKSPAPGHPWILQSNLYDGPITGGASAPGLALLEKGWHVVACSLGNTFGAPSALKKWDELYEVATGAAYGLSRKPVLVGVSREGLAMHRWAAFHPEQVGGIYADRAVCDFKSWPGGKVGIGKGGARGWAELIKAYGFASETEALAYRQNPIDLAGDLVRAGIPLFHVAGEKDEVVPPAENVMVLKARMREAGGDLTLIVVPGAGHNPHGLKDPQPIIDFMLQCAQSRVRK